MSYPSHTQDGRRLCRWSIAGLAPGHTVVVGTESVSGGKPGSDNEELPCWVRAGMSLLAAAASQHVLTHVTALTPSALVGHLRVATPPGPNPIAEQTPPRSAGPTRPHFAFRTMGPRCSVPRTPSRSLPSYDPVTLTTLRADARTLSADACSSHEAQLLAIQLALDTTRLGAALSSAARARTRPPRWGRASSTTRDARASRRTCRVVSLHPELIDSPTPPRSPILSGCAH